MNFNIKNQVGAEFQLTVYRKDGTVKAQTTKFKNIVLDAGLIQMSKGVWFNHVIVGAGSTPPVKTDVALEAKVQHTDKRIGLDFIYNTKTKPYSYTVRSVYRFGEGAAAGNLAEVAIGWSPIACWNRALIRDASGDPTVLVVLEDEFLDVTVDVTFIYPEFTGTFDLVGKRGEHISTHTYSTIPYFYADGWNRIADFNATHLSFISIGTTKVAGVTDYQAVTRLTQVKREINVGSAMYRGKTDLAFTGDIVRIQYVLTGVGLNRASSPDFAPSINIQFDPPIKKTNLQIMEFEGTVTWGRIEEE